MEAITFFANLQLGLISQHCCCVLIKCHYILFVNYFTQGGSDVNVGHVGAPVNSSQLGHSA